MFISSRTPEGLPHRCPVCGKMTMLEPSFPDGDSCCPNCGQLLWWFRDRLSREAGIDPAQITLFSSLFEDFVGDSLNLVELMMEVEATFDVEIPDEAMEGINTVADAIRSIEELRGE